MKWKLVPVEPTDEQLRGLDRWLDSDAPYATQVYRDVLDNAPPPSIPAARLAEMREACNTYGPANCWTGTTGTLAGMVRELLELIGEARE